VKQNLARFLIQRKRLGPSVPVEIGQVVALDLRGLLVDRMAPPIGGAVALLEPEHPTLGPGRREQVDRAVPVEISERRPIAVIHRQGHQFRNPRDRRRLSEGRVGSNAQGDNQKEGDESGH
jgi:hypothetical protein